MPRSAVIRRLAASVILLSLVTLFVLYVKRSMIPTVRYVCPLLTAQQSPSPEFAKCNDCTYYPVDKVQALSATYAPTVIGTGLPGGGSLVPAAANALHALFADAKRFGFSPVVTSAYRAYDEQVTTFSRWIVDEWKHTLWFPNALEAAQRYSARPGHSEHQLGTAVDLNCQNCIPFDDNDTRNLLFWGFLEDNAHRYGFVISYPRGAEERTGYQYEPWHIRYIGVQYATELYKQDYTKGNDVCPSALLRTKHRY